MSDAHAVAEGLTDKAARTLRVLCGGLGGAVAAFALVVAWAYAGEGHISQPNAARLINILTMTAMSWTLAGILAGEFLWRRGVRLTGNPAKADARVSAAFMLRLALREGAALLGLTVCFLAARNGVLRAYPAYWVNSVPALLFAFFLYARWPSLENLRSQVRDV